MFKLMIVDDEKHVREALNELIQWNEIGIDCVETARNGLAGIELAKTFFPDIVLCDMRMPKMNGLEFAAWLKAEQPSCKLIFISGYADKESMETAASLGAAGFIEKPISLDELKSVVGHTVEELKNSMH